MNGMVSVALPSALEASMVMLAAPTSLGSGVYLITPRLGSIDAVGGPARMENVSGLPLLATVTWVVMPAVALTGPYVEMGQYEPLLRWTAGESVGAIHVNPVAGSEYGDRPVEFTDLTRYVWELPVASPETVSNVLGTLAAIRT